MMDIFIAEIPEEVIFNRIKKELSPLSYVECMNCGAVKVDAMEAIRTLDAVLDADFDESDEYEEFPYELGWELLQSLVEIGPDFFSDEDPCWHEYWSQWEKKNWDRLYGWIERYHQLEPLCLKYREVLFLHDRNCDCFREAKACKS